MELIERDLIKKVESMTPEQFHRFIIAVCGAYLRQDAAPMVYGQWIWNPEYCKWICSECGGREGECEAPICKWCGARMDGGEDDAKA